ncbi:kinesin motor domain protein (macronuclear) [Tetrahymena thermophila SB210]|uniref:Kinesin motor domain protein n=1 Tax=Tetrahymena thermophila (strain SB210) TaxID=312017 RepID=Q23U84_TETTS|nr:kinesin motor domain protein [Tetrahymena thermophila SB210]EAS00060.1 kinesin motor domain protein [Tetrahymena thermophila SB210]|eukprot:XP_001020305.1 kinesin motor domain protein [Tetrahymena thermophila SB210]
MASKALRRISKVFSPPQQNEGVGARVHRIIGNQQCRRLDPFLMLDYFQVKLPAGFPDHPHRGFETVTYMLDGTMLHEDFKGNKGNLEPGDIQWMTAGKGIVHAEMPGSFDKTSVGFQLWVNLDKKNKMCDPEYQEYKSEKLPIVKRDGIWIRLIAGEALGEKGPIFTRTPAFYMDVRLEKNVQFDQHIPKDYQGMVFLYEGSIKIGENQKEVQDKQAAIFEPEEGENLNIISGDKGAKFILFAGRPIKEPVYSYGPFVLDSQSSLNDTFEDYQEEKNGFEGASQWQSEIQFLAELNKSK